MISRIAGATLGFGSFAASIVTITPAFAQEGGGDIIVTARRTEERLQDVPISITVYNQTQLQTRNVAVASDLATYTPSLSVNSRFGPEKATFAIRGFNQDAAAAPSVGVYFADVVGVRAQGGTASGNTVGAGSFTDLQNVQVLKGPQGTLFGRNTTGGAVLLVPQRPTGNLEGYAEGTYGNYDQKRVQLALNIPLADTFKIRLAVDRNKRDGYMRNRSGIGPKDYNDVDYGYARLSVLAELTPDLENLTIASYSRSDTNAYASRMEGCDRNPVDPRPTAAGGRNGSLIRYYVATAGCAQVDRQAARGDGPLDVESSNLDPRTLIDVWQVINTTSWQANDDLTLKNIVSYGEYRESITFSNYTDNFSVVDTPVTRYYQALGGPAPGRPFQTIALDTQDGYKAALGSTTTEELQLQGRGFDEKLNYVVGGYLEFSRPLGWNQQRTGIYGNCADPATLNCIGGIAISPASPFPAALVSESRTKYSFDNHGIFAQGTFKFSDSLTLTLGGRWTFDRIKGEGQGNRYTLFTIPGVGTVPVSRVCNDNLNHPTVNLLTNGGNIAACSTRIVAKSNRPTWLVGIDYKPNSDTLLYAKYSRGYRQGAVNFTNPGLETVGPEKVDAYEIGAKMTFRGSFPGYFNVAGFYNDFSDQQIFAQLVAKPTSGLAGGAGLINAGRSKIQGVEVDAAVTAFDILRFGAAYTYLDTELKSVTAPILSPDSPFSAAIPNGVPGGPLAYAPKHKLTLSSDIVIPLGDGRGEASIGAVFVYTASQFIDPVVTLPSYSLLSFNAGLTNVGGTGISVTAFANNVTNKKYRTSYGGAYESSGLLDYHYGQPRMYGLRLRFNFGT